MRAMSTMPHLLGREGEAELIVAALQVARQAFEVAGVAQAEGAGETGGPSRRVGQILHAMS